MIPGVSRGGGRLRRTAAISLVVLTAALRGATLPPEAPAEGVPGRPGHAAPAAAVLPPPVPAGTRPAGEYPFVGFDQLAGFAFAAPAAQVEVTPAVEAELMRQIPGPVAKLDGQRVSVTGFMLPTRFERGLATEFLLLNSPLMCCFGVTPSANAWIVVTLPRGVAAVQDVPRSFHGRLRVRPQWEGGWLTSVYQLEGDAEDRPAP